ncbi:ROK family protein, partial [Candidatus Gastranaerophilus sp. (ex Termes propinquus)]
EKGNEKISEKLLETVEQLLKISKVPKNQVETIGIGAAGQVERREGILLNAVNLDCKDMPLKKLLEEKFDIPTHVGNDVEVATLGEMNFGAGVDFCDIVCIFAGTGIGSSIVKGGKIHLGASQSAGEIGHMVIDINGRACSCGANGCLEAYASRSAIETRILGAIKKDRKSIITDLVPKMSSISSKHIKQALDAHDEVVTHYVNEAIEHLAEGLANVMNFFNPELIILGGGLIQGIDEFYLKTIKLARAKALPIPSERIIFKKAELGDYSGVIGATMLAKRELAPLAMKV